MLPNEGMTSFIYRFRRYLEHLSDVTISQPMPTDFELSSLFLHKCMLGTKEGSDLHSTILDYRRKLKRAIHPSDITFTLDMIETELCQLDSSTPSIPSKSFKPKQQLTV